MGGIIDFFKAVAGICKTEPLAENLWERNEGKVAVNLAGVPQLQQQGGAVYLQGKGLERPLLLVRSKDGSIACFENRCTHMGRKIDPSPEGDELVCCSVSHARYGLDGSKVSGPAKGPLKAYTAETEGDRLVISLKD